jgi:hypothetical protein
MERKVNALEVITRKRKMLLTVQGVFPAVVNLYNTIVIKTIYEPA